MTRPLVRHVAQVLETAAGDFALSCSKLDNELAQEKLFIRY